MMLLRFFLYLCSRNEKRVDHRIILLGYWRTGAGGTTDYR